MTDENNIELNKTMQQNILNHGLITIIVKTHQIQTTDFQNPALQPTKQTNGQYQLRYRPTTKHWDHTLQLKLRCCGAVARVIDKTL